MHEPLITVIGNVAGPPRQRTTPAGVAVADFRVAATPRRQDRATGAWADGETMWFSITAWRALAENTAASLRKGDRVMVAGRLSARTWETDTGERRSGLEIEATSIGLELSRSPAHAVRPSPLVTDADAWISSGRVDPDTGEVHGEDRDEPVAGPEVPAQAAAGGAGGASTAVRAAA